MKIFRKANDLKNSSGATGVFDIALTEEEVKKAVDVWFMDETSKLIAENVMKHIHENPSCGFSDDWAIRFGRAKKGALMDSLKEDKELKTLIDKLADKVTSEKLIGIGLNPKTMTRL